MKSISIGEGVKQLWPEYRLWEGRRAALIAAASDPTSRMAGIRDVTLHVLPYYLPDPRRRVDFAADKAAETLFLKKYAPDGRGDLIQIRADFPNVPDVLRSVHKFLCHDGNITLIGEHGGATYRNGRVVNQLPTADIVHSGNGVFYSHADGAFIIAGTMYTYPCSPEKCTALPCGLILEFANGKAKLVNVVTCEYAVVTKDERANIFDDFGDPQSHVNLYAFMKVISY